MLIRLTSFQIPHFWEAIRFATGRVSNIRDDMAQKYFNKLLNNLLSDRSSCYVSLSEDRKLEWLFILRLGKNELTEENTLVIDCMYSFVRKEDEEYKKVFEEFIRFAKKNNCKYINMWTSNLRIEEIAGFIGFEERYKLFTYDVRD